MAQVLVAWQECREEAQQEKMQHDASEETAAQEADTCCMTIAVAQPQEGIEQSRSLLFLPVA